MSTASPESQALGASSTTGASARFKFNVLDGSVPPLRVARLSGVEEMSTYYQFELTLVSELSAIPFEDVVGQAAVLWLLDGATERVVHGIVSAFAQAEQGRRVTVYHATLVPEVYRLQYRVDSRIFQDKTTLEIVKAVFEAAGIDGARWSTKLTRTYEPRGYCVQYQESDWDFVNRLLEDEGIHYWFDHTPTGHMMVLGDSPSAHEPIVGNASLAFAPNRGGMSGAESVHRFRAGQQIVPGKVTLRDWIFENPSLDLTVEKHTNTAADLEIYDYPGNYEEPNAGTITAATRLQLWQRSQNVVQGRTSSPRLLAGHLMSLTNHPRQDLDASYLLTKVTHTGVETTAEDGVASAEDSYSNDFEGIPSAVPFRPQRKTPRPRVNGVESAIVVGPADEEIYTDQYGRVKAQFHWDRQGQSDEHSSCWMRVSQVWAGQGWGGMFIPRVGHEVLVDFLEGNPDKPVIVGRVYHGTNVPPYALPGEKTKSTLMTRSTPKGAGYNELRFEDKKGEEQVYLQAEKNLRILVKNDKSQNVGNDETLEVGHDRTKKVDHCEYETIGKDKTIKVVNDHHEEIGNDLEHTVANNATYSVGGNRDETVTNDASMTVHGKLTTTVDADQTGSVGGNASLTVTGNETRDVSGTLTMHVAGDVTQSLDGKLTATIGGEVSIMLPNSTHIYIGTDGSISLFAGQNDLLIVGASVSVSASTLDLQSSGDVSLQASGNVTIQGSSVKVN